MTQINFDEINASALSLLRSLVQAWLPAGEFKGTEYMAINPTRPDSSPGSFSINTESGKWSDFATGETGGDPISLYAYINTIKQGEAAKAVADQCGQPVATPQTERKHNAKKAETWRQINPVPADAPDAPNFFPKKEGGKWTRYNFTYRWAYHNQMGELLGYIGRVDRGKEKEIYPVTFRENEDGERKWKYKQFDSPRPLMGLHDLAHNPATPVIVVEGEKCHDVLQEIMGTLAVVITWSGGGKAAKKTDFTPLEGRQVVLWPDADKKTYPAHKPRGGEIMDPIDQPGIMSMYYVALKLKDKAAVKILTLPTDRKDGWDCADAIINEGWGIPEIMGFIKENINDLDPAGLAKHENAPAPPMLDIPPPDDEWYQNSITDSNTAPAEDTEDAGYISAQDKHFNVLGYSRGIYYYLPRGSNQILALGSNQHNSGHLYSLAPLNYWEKAYYSKSGPDWSAIHDHLIRQCEAKGVYDSKLIRGAGAWYDRGRVVLHLGDHLLENGRRVEIGGINSRYIYEAGPPTEYLNAEPLDNHEANKYQKICDMLFWDKAVYGKLLAGWCAIAPICGALNWRPHIWLTGGSGTGKTYTMKNIIKPVIGNAGLYVQSATTEAGLRQSLGNDAWPVIFDEIEGENSASQKRIEVILELMRQASSDTGASILKGSTSGKVQLFQVRSSFCLSSIGVNISQFADISRISILGLRSPTEISQAKKAAHFAKLNAAIVETITEQYGAAFRARSIKLIPVIRKNADTFAKAVAAVIGNQRIGDQLGALLAGAFSLASVNEIKYENAVDWVKSQEWEEQAPNDIDTDENRLLSFLLEQVIRVQYGNTTIERSIGELLIDYKADPLDNLAYDQFSNPDGRRGIKSSDIDATIKRMGIKYDHQTKMIVISNSHSGLKRLLRETSWPKNWGRILLRIEGAELVHSARFGGAVTRGTAIPWACAFPDDDADGGEVQKWN